MKIKQIHIENYGKINNLTLNFNDNINEIIENNGYGKTTLMSFIKAMFYGLTSTTSKSLQKNERLKYSPWNKGIYGGYMICEFEDIEYRIERTFANKSSNDECSVYNLKTMENLNIEDVGMYFLNLDENSFERSIYIGNNMLEIPVSSVLIGQLTKQNSKGQESISNYESALKILDKKRSFYSKKGENGAIYQIKENIKKLERQLLDIQQSFENSKRYDEEIKELKEKEYAIQENIKEIEESLQKVAQLKEIIATKKHFDSLKSKKDKIINDIKNIESKCIQGLPTNEALQSCSEKLIYNTNQKALRDECKNKLQETQLKYQDIENLENNINKSKEYINNLESLKNFNIKNLIFTLLPFSLIFIIFGIISIISINLIIGICSIVVGLAITMLFIYKYIKEQKHNKNKNLIYKDLKDILSLKENFTIQEAKNILVDLENECKIYKSYEKDITTYNKNIEKTEKELNIFFKSFKTKSVNDLNALDEIKSYKINYNTLSQELEVLNNEIESFDKKLLDNKTNNLNSEDLNNNKKDLQKQIKEINNLIIQKTNKKNSEDIKVDSKFEIDAELNKNQELLQKYEKELFCILKAMDYLKESKLELGNKYIIPAQNKLDEFINLCPHLKAFEPIRLKEEDLTITYQELGKIRTQESLSTGLQCSISILVRFALASIIFDNEPCTLILDDPFSTLDKKNFGYIKDTLKMLSTKYQIIYFSCDKSRSLLN